jgi:hypothetical protein
MPVEELGARQLAALGRVGSRLESENIADLAALASAWGGDAR